jgi:predicted nucleotidyltransferase
MHPQIAAAQQQIREICRRFHVERLELVGSAATGTHEPGRAISTSWSSSTFARTLRVRRYFDSRKRSKRAAPVDLVMRSGLKNPYFRASIEQHRLPIYGA